MAGQCLLKKKRRIFAVSIWSKSGWMRPMLHSTTCNTGNVLYNLVQYKLVQVQYNLVQYNLVQYNVQRVAVQRVAVQRVAVPHNPLQPSAPFA